MADNIQNRKSSFEPLAAPDATILILGSLPGDRSISLSQYYGHPQNRFWRILAGLFDAEVPESYEQRKSFLAQKRIAVWDVAHSAQRVGSLDSKILDVIPNDLDGFLNTHPQIRRIAFNGKTSEKMFDRYFKRMEGIDYISLPSSSPANASKSLAALIDDWRKILG